MNNLKNDSYYVGKALEQVNIIYEHFKGVESLDELIADDVRLDAIMFRLIQLVEQIKYLSAEYKEAHHWIPWGDIIGFRNGIVHEYGATDYSIVWEVLSRYLSDLKELFENTLN